MTDNTPRMGIAPGGSEWALFQGDSLEILKTFGENSFHSMVTDPPSGGLEHQNREWDSDRGGRDAWIAWLEQIMREAFRVLKPGAHALVWQMPRYSHWTMTALENAGFEPWDICHHLFKNGFPKSQNIRRKAASSKKDQVRGAAEQFVGLETALKNASEHWLLVRKPISEPSVAENILKWGTGGLAVDATRVQTAIDDRGQPGWTRNVVLSEDADAHALDVARFFYVPKPCTREKNEGLEHLPKLTGGQLTIRKEGAAGLKSPRAGAGRLGDQQNSHPTVKSVALMRYWNRLITPPNGLILDPFCGSGTTVIAAGLDDFNCVAIEKEAQYVDLAEARIRSWLKGETHG